MFRRSLAAVASAALILLAGCAGDDLSDNGTASEDKTVSPGEVHISGQSFPEAVLVTAMYVEVLRDAGYTPTVNLVDTRDVYMQQFPGDVDVVPEYVGSLADFLSSGSKKSISSTDTEETIQNMKPLLEEQGITLLEPAAATDANAFFVTKEYAEQNDVSALSDLEGQTVTLAAAPDCADRPDCGAGLQDVYGIDIKEILPLGFASQQTYDSVLGGESQLGLTSTTDGTLESQGLVMLEDDKSIQTAQNLIPAVSTEYLDEHEGLDDLLNSLMATLTTEKLTELNGRVTVDREQPEDVARDFLVQEGLIGD